jgi:hypothetical protein
MDGTQDAFPVGQQRGEQPQRPGPVARRVMNGSLVAKLAAQRRAEWMICTPLGQMAEPAAQPPAKKSR